MYQHAMIPMDGSELAECVLPHLEKLSRDGKKIRKITLARVVEPFHVRGGLEARFGQEERERLEEDAIKLAQEYLDQIASKLSKKGIKADSAVLCGRVVEKLIEYEKDNEVDLVIISTHGHSGPSRWVWGNTADRILRNSNVPVLMVRAQC